MSKTVYFASGQVVTTSGNSNGDTILEHQISLPPIAGPQNIAVLLNATAVSGTTPSLTVEVQWSHDGQNFASATTADTFTALTAVGTALKQFTVKGKYARLKYTVSGTTPSFTLTASGYVA